MPIGYNLASNNLQSIYTHKIHKTSDIFSDAHRCASKRMNPINSKKINFFDQNIVILDSYFSFLGMDKTKGVNNNDILGTQN